MSQPEDRRTSTSRTREFYHVQCAHADCRLRFPVPVADAGGQHCPRCGSRTTTQDIQTNPTSSTLPPPAPGELLGCLDNIRSLHNVGSVFRTADGAGIKHLFLCGITGTPENPRLVKSSLGAENSVPWSHHLNSLDLLSSLRLSGYNIWGLERWGSQPQTDIFEIEPPHQATVLVIGHEKAGVDERILAMCDQIVSLPMSGRKTSLNAAVAFGIAAYVLRFAKGSKFIEGA